MNKIIDQFMNTLAESGLGQVLGFAVVMTAMLVIWGAQNYICKKFDLW